MRWTVARNIIVFLVLSLFVSLAHGDAEGFVIDYDLQEQANGLLKGYFGDLYKSNDRAFRVIGSRSGVYLLAVRGGSLVTLYYRSYEASPDEAVGIFVNDTLSESALLDFRIYFDASSEVEYSITLLSTKPFPDTTRRVNGYVHQIERDTMLLTSKFDLAVGGTKIVNIAQPLVPVNRQSGYDYELVKTGVSLDPVPSLVTVKYVSSKGGPALFKVAYQRALDVRRGKLAQKKDISESARLLFGAN